jgi:hypothetical protein
MRKLVLAAALLLAPALASAQPAPHGLSPAQQRNVARALAAARADMANGVTCVRLLVEGDEVNYVRCAPQQPLRQHGAR